MERVLTDYAIAIGWGVVGAIIMAAVILALGIAVGFAIMPVSEVRP
jgi:hypothetical protein